VLISNNPISTWLRSPRALAAVGLLIWLALHVYWSLRTEINWDEFALLARASDSLREGRLFGAGRPGLATLVLMPLVDGCKDAVSAVRLATFHALVGVALIALTPDFLRFAVQVRTDQPAIAMGLLGGALLLSSRQRPRVALSAGLLFGIGYLFSQKLVYVAAMVSLLAVADLLLKEDFRLRRELGRGLGVAGGFVVILVGYRGVISLLWEPPLILDVGGQMDVFRFYREVHGYRYYREMVPYLLGPIGLLAVQLVFVPSGLRRGGKDRLVGLLVIAVLALGLSVGLFHAGAFPYFWMTLGLFPAVALAIGLPLVLRLPKWTRRRILGPFWAVFMVTAVYVGTRMSVDGQATQRTTLEFVRANIPPELEGFHNTRALFCRDTVDPLPVLFAQDINATFTGEGAVEAAEQMIAEFRGRPIGFLIRTFRWRQFPESVRQFWDEHYVPYSGSLYLAGTSIDDTRAPQFDFEVIVPGTYAFYSSDTEALIWIGSAELGPGETIRLEAGYHRIDRSQSGRDALLALAIQAPPGPINDDFYRAF